MLAMKLCLERVLPRCHERPVMFSLPSLAAVGNGEIDEPSPQNVSRAMNAVTSARERRDHAGRGGNDQRSPGSTRLSCERPALPGRRLPAAICCRCRRPATMSKTKTRTSAMPKPSAIATRRRRRPTPARQFVEASLFNPREKSSCKFSADAGSGIAVCNSWLIFRKAARGSPTARRQSANRRRGAIRGWSSHA